MINDGLGCALILKSSEFLISSGALRASYILHKHFKTPLSFIENLARIHFQTCSGCGLVKVLEKMLPGE